MTAVGAGPRHIAFHPSAPFAYRIAETASTMTSYAFDTSKGTLSALATLSTLPAGFTGTNTGAEVEVAPSGRFVYGSNRGSDTIAVFAVDATTGQLTAVDHTPTGGQTPRHFSIDPTGQILLVANQGTGNVVTFRMDAATGKLTQLGTTPVGASPFYVQAVAPTP
jgi:6-phosphogluconolactonase